MGVFTWRSRVETAALGEARKVVLTRQRLQEAEFPGNPGEAGREFLEDNMGALS